MSHHSEDFTINRHRNKGESRDFIRKGSASVYSTEAERSLSFLRKKSEENAETIFVQFTLTLFSCDKWFVKKPLEK